MIRALTGIQKNNALGSRSIITTKNPFTHCVNTRSLCNCTSTLVNTRALVQLQSNLVSTQRVHGFLVAMLELEPCVFL